MESKTPSKVEVVKEDWDILIVLDACRYDFFKKNYKDFLKGKLEKRISVGVNTPTWLKNNFKDYYKDIVYISGNPFVNSKRVDINNVGFEGPDHFFLIVDAWDFGFDRILNTVHPLSINKAFMDKYQQYPNKRFILHYIQPHYPYASLDPKYIKLQENMFIKKMKRKNGNHSKQTIHKIIPHSLKWKMGSLLRKAGFNIRMGLGKVYIDKGWKGIRKAYQGDLRFALKHISDLVNNIDGKIIITADHGERLGKKGKFGHGGKRDKAIVEVPWLKVHNNY